MQLFINILTTACIILLIAQSFSIIFYPAKFFHLAHAICITMGAYLTYFFARQFHFDVWLSISFSLILVLLFGILLELGIYRKLRRRNATTLVLLIASIGIYTVLQNVISLLWGDSTLTITTDDIEEGHIFFGAHITTIQICTISISILLFITTLLFIKYSKTGKNLRAVSENQELSNVFGIDHEKILLYSFAIGSFLAGIAGVLIAFDFDMKPTMGFNYLLFGVVAMIIGGVGSTRGLILGAALVASAQHLSAFYFGSVWMDMIAYIILIAFLVWKPMGFSGKHLKKIEI